MAELETKVAQPEDVLPRNELDSTYSPPATTEEGNAEEQKMQLDFLEDEGVVSTLRSFTPQEDLSELQPEERQSEAANVEQKVEMPTVEEAPETSPVNEEFVPEMDLHREDVDQKIEQDVEVAEAQEDIVEELGYEIISKQDVKKMPEPEIHRDAEEPKLESGQEKEQKMEMEAEEKVLDVSPEEEVIEADYDIIDAEEQKMQLDFIEDEGVVSTLRSFTPQEDLSELQPEERQSEAADVEQKKWICTKRMSTKRSSKMVEVAEAQEDIVEELGYDIISKQDVKKMPEPEIHRDAEEPKLESGQEKEQKMEMEAEEIVLDVSPEEEVIEADYDIIDAEEQSQAQLAAELQGMDWFCPTCGGLLAEDDCSSGEHHDHEVTAVDQAYEESR
ncbi:hypothetical protein KUCAC02_028511 [Chaenocephalus aceratus]|uniref:Uncharacterized protein n=1 Tax=Chaenocephalus aceratus TaxID=36190 RepID=A0ACB9X2U3_CHAAC|nr:hypothetical protein KUCAC02_028511 [Chaenocephalus aceratus]